MAGCRARSVSTAASAARKPDASGDAVLHAVSSAASHAGRTAPDGPAAAPMSRAAPQDAPVLFLHGAFSCGGHLHAWSQRFSAAGYTCVTPSLPGHDPSDPDLLKTLTLRDYLAAAQECRSRASAPPIIVGHSMGGLLAQQLAATGPCAALV